MVDADTAGQSLIHQTSLRGSSGHFGADRECRRVLSQRLESARLLDYGGFPPCVLRDWAVAVEAADYRAGIVVVLMP